MWSELALPVVIAHRGDKIHAPENTLASFRSAAEKGADAVEFDVKLSADGHVVVMHDATVDRTTDGSGKVSRPSLAALRELDAGAWFSDKFRGEHIPILEEIFEAVGNRLYMNIELTNYATPMDGLVDKVAECVRKSGLGKNVLFSSFYAGNLIRARRLLPQVPCGLLTWAGWMGWPGRTFGFRGGAYAALHPNISDATAGLAERVHAAGKRLNVWTVNSEEDLKRMIGLGVDGIFTDDPGLALRMLGRAHLIPDEWLDQAALRIAPHIRRTLVTNDAELNLYLKWENRQVTGSFKARGALNKVLALEPWETQAGLVTASAGNHGQGVALAAGLVGAQVTVFVSTHAVPAKLEAMRHLGVDLHPVDGGYEAAEAAAIRYASAEGKTWISPYNDGLVITGQGTIGLELLQDLPEAPDLIWLVPVGGGGLLAGIGAALERAHPRPRLVGVQSEASAFMHALFHRGTQDGVSDLPSLADGLAGAVEDGSLTVPLVRRYADDILLVSETEIGQAVAWAWHRYHERIEGSGAVGLAAILSGKVESPAVVIVSGGTIQLEVHEALCRRYPKQ